MIVQIWCGPSSCLASPDASTELSTADDKPFFRCPSGFICRPIQDQDCFTPPCRPWGTCENSSDVNIDVAKESPGTEHIAIGDMYDIIDGTPSLSCGHDGQQISSVICIRILLTFNLHQMPVVRTSH